jgi:hypothetical protein
MASPTKITPLASQGRGADYKSPTQALVEEELMNRIVELRMEKRDLTLELQLASQEKYKPSPMQAERIERYRTALVAISWTDDIEEIKSIVREALAYA